jgi:threonyl-tRNA synthetase
MNDAHIYCTKEQFYEEFKAVNAMYLKYFSIFGIDKYVMRLSLHSPEKLGQKYVNEPELWKETEALVRDVLIKTNTPFVEVQDEGRVLRTQDRCPDMEHYRKGIHPGH